jgi:molybdopterin-containing oxidoreductase family iron-sulfur binding subunit
MWRKSLHDGIVYTAASKPAEPLKLTADVKKISAAAAAEPKAPVGLIEVGFVPSAQVWDGRFANNGWMQEVPEPMTKLVWATRR